MSAISTILTRLADTVALVRSAIFAIDVRDDIADAIEKCGEAIEQCYSDVSNPTLQTEALEAALQEKIDQGEMAALTIGDGTITAAKLAAGVIDNTLATSGAAADAAETGRQFGLIKADLDAQVADINESLGAQTGIINKKAGYYINLTVDPVDISNPSSSSTGLAYAVVNCSEGDKFVINATGATSGRAWGFLDSSNHVLSMADANATVTDLELTAPTNAVKLIINDKSDGMSYKVGNNLASKIDTGGGLSIDAKIALLGCLDNVTWDNKNGRNYYNILKEALNLGLTSISAVFNQGNSVITSTDDIDDLRAMLTVTGSDGREIKTYTLSGNLNSAISTITVKVNELTTTFPVNVSSLPSGYTEKSYVQANGSQRIPSGIYEPDMVGVWIRQKQCTTELLDKAGHILSSTNYFVPYQRYFPSSNLRRISYNRFGGQTTSYDKPGNYWNVNEDVIIESFKDVDKIFVNGEHVATLPTGSTMSSSNQLYFFKAGTNTSANFAFRGRLYYLKIFSASGVKLHDFVPCKNSSNVAGLYDLVTGEFHAPDTGTLLTD